MSSSIMTIPFRSDRDLHRLVWLTLTLFLSYLCVAMSLPVISVFVTTQLGYGNALAGLAVGVAFGSTILTRGLAGRMADHQGSKYCMVRGLCIYTLASLVCGAASWRGLPALAAYGVLIAGRLLLGVGESLAVVGLMAWCFGIMGPRRSGPGLRVGGAWRCMAPSQSGSPIGLALFDWAGFRRRDGRLRACPPDRPGDGALPFAAGGAASRRAHAVLAHHRAHLGTGRGPLALAGVGSAASRRLRAAVFHSPGLAACRARPDLLRRRVRAGAHPVRVTCPTAWAASRVALVSIAIEALGQYLLWTAFTPTMALARRVPDRARLFPGLPRQWASRSSGASRRICAGTAAAAAVWRRSRTWHSA